uniref:Transmembrane protein (PGPGW) n=1 Tax=Rhodopseudomonas palustris (strain BisA53) TaxID=316055 RepID=Q07JJ1_RHOP5
MSHHHHKAELDRHLAWFEDKLPQRPARFVGWLRKPSSRLVRIPLSILLMVGGFFAFLPVLGFWMLPLGLILIAQDLPFLQGPIARTLGWVERKWLARQARSGAKRGRKLHETL